MRLTDVALYFVIFIAFTFSGCTTLAEIEQRRAEKPAMVIRAGKVYEECLPLVPPQVLEYSFTASKGLEFNIHYHGDEAVYPVQGSGVLEWQGVFDPTACKSYSSEQPPFFCLMWTNPHEEEVELYFDILVRDKE